MILIFLVVAYYMHYDSKKTSEWHDRKEIITVKVAKGIKLSDYCTQYKPTWMTNRYYRHEIMELNDLSKSALHEGQILKLYYVAEKN